MTPMEEIVFTIVEVFENFLEEKGIDVPNEEKSDSENPANIYGTDYYNLKERVTEVLKEGNVCIQSPQHSTVEK